MPSAILDKDNEYIERAISQQIEDKSLIQVQSLETYLQIQERLTGKSEQEKEQYFKERTDASGPSKKIENKESNLSEPNSSEKKGLDELGLSQEAINRAKEQLKSEPPKSAMKKPAEQPPVPPASIVGEPQKMSAANFDADASETNKKKTSLFSSLREKIKDAIDKRKEKKKHYKEAKEAISDVVLAQLSKLKDIEKSISSNTEEQDKQVLEKASLLKEVIENIRATKPYEKSDTIFLHTEAAIAKASTINKKIEDKINKKQESKSSHDAKPTINHFYKHHQAKENGKKSEVRSEQDMQQTQKTKTKLR